MGESRPRPGKRRPARAARAFILAVLFGLAGGAPGYADLRPPARPRGEPPMRFVRVVSADPSCAPNCPEWLSAEGRIEPGSATAFINAVDRLGGRRLPILIHSPGGSVPDAMAMGELIRGKGLAVAVARTLMPNCAETAPRCPDGPGRAITGGATCASACALVLAGGVERLVGPVPLVGVHQITTVVKEIESLSRLTSTRKYYEQQGADAAVSRYLAAMGVGDPVMALLRKTPAASVYWLSLADLRASRLATLALDPAEPVLARGANGLNGSAFDGDPPPPDLVAARAREPLALPIEGRAATLEVTLRYRRGGGGLEAELAALDADTGKPADPPATGWSLTFAGAGESLPLKSAGTPARALIPRERFCALASGGKLVAAPPVSLASGSWANEPPITFELAGMEGRTTVADEACP
jgi:hypothetical protein